MHTRHVSEFYRGRRDVFEAALKKHLQGLAEWTSPEAGMFVWYISHMFITVLPGAKSSLTRFKLLLSPPGSTEAEEDSATVIRTHALEKGVLALPGTVFLPNGRKTAYVRASFSLLGDAQIDEALRRLGAVVLQARNGKV